MKTLKLIIHWLFLLATFISASSLLYRVWDDSPEFGNEKEIFTVVLVFTFMSLMTSKYSNHE